MEIDIEGVQIFADKLLEKVFYHLIENAIQYGEKITRIRLSCDESFEELLIVCEDDGIGIPRVPRRRSSTACSTRTRVSTCTCRARSFP